MRVLPSESMLVYEVLVSVLRSSLEVFIILFLEVVNFDGSSI